MGKMELPGDVSSLLVLFLMKILTLNPTRTLVYGGRMFKEYGQ